jgi:hypothetical protein
VWSSPGTLLLCYSCVSPCAPVSSTLAYAHCPFIPPCMTLPAPPLSASYPDRPDDPIARTLSRHAVVPALTYVWFSLPAHACSAGRRACVGLFIVRACQSPRVRCSHHAHHGGQVRLSLSAGAGGAAGACALLLRCGPPCASKAASQTGPPLDLWPPRPAPTAGPS